MEVVDAVKVAHEQAFVTYEETREGLYIALTTGQTPVISSIDLIERSNVALDFLMEVSNAAMVAAEQQALLKEANANRSLFFHSSLLALGFLVGFAGFQVVQHRVTRPISAITQVMRRLAVGEVAVEVPDMMRKDEIGQMANAVQVFKENALERLRLAKEHGDARERAAADRKAEMHQLADHFEAAVGNIVKIVSSSATELEATAGSLASTAETTGQLAGRVATSSQQVFAHVRSVSTATEEMSASVREISRQVEESNLITNQAVEQARKTDANISELSRAAGRIGELRNGLPVLQHVVDGRLFERERHRHQRDEEQRRRQDARHGDRRPWCLAKPPHARSRPASMIRARNSRVRSSRGDEKIWSGGPSSRMTPPSRKQILSATSRAKPISCVARTIVIPVSASCRTRLRTSPTS